MRDVILYGCGILTGTSLVGGLQSLTLHRWLMLVLEGSLFLLSALVVLMLVWRDASRSDTLAQSSAR